MHVAVCAYPHHNREPGATNCRGRTQLKRVSSRCKDAGGTITHGGFDGGGGGLSALVVTATEVPPAALAAVMVARVAMAG